MENGWLLCPARHGMPLPLARTAALVDDANVRTGCASPSQPESKRFYQQAAGSEVGADKDCFAATLVHAHYQDTLAD